MSVIAVLLTKVTSHTWVIWKITILKKIKQVQF